MSSSAGREKPLSSAVTPTLGYELTLDLDTCETPPLSRILTSRSTPLLLDCDSLTTDMRDEASSYTIRGRDKPVLLSLARDNPVGFLYIEGLLESRGGMTEFLYSLISG